MDSGKKSDVPPLLLGPQDWRTTLINGNWTPIGKGELKEWVGGLCGRLKALPNPIADRILFSCQAEVSAINQSEPVIWVT